MPPAVTVVLLVTFIVLQTGPCVFQSVRILPSNAVKYKKSFTAIRFAGAALSAPVFISDTIVVPPAVPSLFQSSTPCVPSSAVKYSIPFEAVN